MCESIEQNIIQKFSTMYEFTIERGSLYVKPMKNQWLVSSIKNLAESHLQWRENDYIQYFLDILKDKSKLNSEQKYAHLHLIAYLEKTRFFTIKTFLGQHPWQKVKAEQCVNLTNEVIYSQEKFKQYLARYHSQNPNKANLKTYMQGVFKNILREEFNIESPWHLLCHVDIQNYRKFRNAEQTLRDALVIKYEQIAKIEQYIFAWKHFVPIYLFYLPTRLAPNSQGKRFQRWPEPEESDFEEAAREYNLYRLAPNTPLEISSGSDITGEELRKWMEKICIPALQERKKVIELIYIDPENYQYELDEFIDIWENLEQISEEYDKTLRKQLEVINEEIEKIELPNNSYIPREYRKAVMPLCYHHQFSLLTQQQFSYKIRVAQSNISRFINHFYKNPIYNLIQENKVIDAKKIDIEKITKWWLKEYYKIWFSNELKKIYEQLTSIEKDIIKMKYCQQMPETIILNDYTTSDIFSIIDRVKEKLKIDFIQEIKQTFSIDLTEEREKVAQVVESWLKNLYTVDL